MSSKTVTITEVRNALLETMQDGGLVTHWCLTHNGQSDTGGAHCSKRRERHDHRAVANYNYACSIRKVRVVL